MFLNNRSLHKRVTHGWVFHKGNDEFITERIKVPHTFGYIIPVAMKAFLFVALFKYPSLLAHALSLLGSNNMSLGPALGLIVHSYHFCLSIERYCEPYYDGGTHQSMFQL